MRVVSLRAWLLLGFVVAMPVLALPPVARQVDELLYGPPPSDFGRPAAAPPLQEPIPQQAAGQVVPAGFIYDEQGPAAGHLAAAQAASAFAVQPALDFESSPPPLAPDPAFLPLQPPPSPAAAAQIRDETIARLQQIRDRLEGLGADYILVETTGDGRYRFHCQMQLDTQTNFKRPFEAVSIDPLAAGEEVLRSVEAWRSAAR